MPNFLQYFELQVYSGLVLILSVIYRYMFNHVNSIEMELDKFEITLIIFTIIILLNSTYNFYELGLSFDNEILIKYFILIFSCVCLKLFFFNFKDLNINFLKLLHKTLLGLLLLLSFLIFIYFNNYNYFIGKTIFLSNLDIYFTRWGLESLISDKHIILTILLLPALYFKEWIKNHLSVFLIFFVILFTKIKGGILFLSIFLINLIIKKNSKVLWFVAPLIFFTTYKFLEEAISYYIGITFNQTYEIKSYGIHNRVYFLIDQLSYLKFNFLNGLGRDFFQEIKILEETNYLSSHTSLLNNLTHYGIFSFILYILFIFKLSYIKRKIFDSILIFSLIIILILSQDVIVNILPIIIFYRYLKDVKI